jgi:hypothetical protein
MPSMAGSSSSRSHSHSVAYQRIAQCYTGRAFLSERAVQYKELHIRAQGMVAARVPAAPAHVSCEDADNRKYRNSSA